MALWLAAGVGTYQIFRVGVEELFDDALKLTARLLMAQLVRQLEVTPDDRAAQIHALRSQPPLPFQEHIAFQLYAPDGALLLATGNAPRQRMVALQKGYRTTRLDGENWRTYTLLDADTGAAVQVAAALRERRGLVRLVERGTLVPALITSPLLAALIWFGVSGGLAPLRRITAQVATRSPDNLEPVESADSPGEIRPLLQALNTLFARVARTLEQERRFTAHAAHELRTPLTRLRVQAQVALRADDPEQRAAALQHLIEGVDQSTHLVRQLLTLARLDPAVAAAAWEPVPMRELIERTCEELSPQAQARGQRVECDFGPAPPVRGQPSELAVLTRNLIENALKYSPAGTAVRVQLRGVDGGTEMTVRDSGPGIPATERERVFERFYRQPDSDAPGSGLGLAIVREIVARHGANIRLGNRPKGGLEVAVRFPGRPRGATPAELG